MWQFRTRRYVAAAYWSLAYAIAIFGTGVSDALHLFVGIPYAGTTLLWAVVLALLFWLWHRSEGTLSIHSIVTLAVAILVGYLTVTRRDIQSPRVHPAGSGTDREMAPGQTAR